MLQHDLESYFVGNNFYLDEFTLHLDAEYMPQMRDYCMLQIAFSDVMNTYLKGIPANPLPYGLYCCAWERDMSPYASMLLYLYTSLIYACTEQTEYAVAHLQKSCSIAEANRIEFAIAFAVHYSPQLFQLAL